MNKVSRDNIKKSTLVISNIAILLLVTITSSPTMNSSAFDLGIISKDNNVGSIDTSSLFNCVGAAITCDNDNTVNNNISTNNGTNGGGGDERGTLTVTKQITCESAGGSPNNEAVCDFAENSVNYAFPSDFEMVMAGNEVSPDTFDGSSTGTPVTMNPGSYVVNEISSYDETNLADELNAASVSVQATDATGDCTFENVGGTLAEGTMTSGGSQECTIVNTIFIQDGTVPGAP
jgi:hypothetical protein